MSGMSNLLDRGSGGRPEGSRDVSEEQSLGVMVLTHFLGEIHVEVLEFIEPHMSWGTRGGLGCGQKYFNVVFVIRSIYFRVGCVRSTLSRVRVLMDWYPC